MPAVSVDTFFACSLMVLLVLSAMASTTKLLYPYINNTAYDNAVERYREISKYMLLNNGNPADWGKNPQTIPETFGLANSNSDYPYELDMDKVTRLNNANVYALSYAQVFSALKMLDTSFRIEIKPLFDVVMNLTETFTDGNETVYQFRISTEKNGASVQANLRYYVVAENYLETSYVTNPYATKNLNITLSNNIKGPVTLIALAKTVYNSDIVSYGVYTFKHNSEDPKANGTFLKLSPLNYSLNTTYMHSDLNLSKAYVLTLNYNSTLTQTSLNNQSVKYDVPCFLDASPFLLVVTGWNFTAFFAEWSAYPQVPLTIGADFTHSAAQSNVYANTYVITINSVLYECTIWLGGPRE